MDTIQKLFEEALAHTPYEMLAKIIVGKLGDRGITLTAREQKQLIAHLKSGSSESFRSNRWRWWDKSHFKIELTDDDIERLHTRFTEFLEHSLPDVVRSAVVDLATGLLPALDRNWRAQSRSEERERRGFEKRLRQRWGSAIDRLRMFVALAREFGEGVNMGFRGQQAKHPHLEDVLTRLHARACQVAQEIVCLLGAGLADGAMARWRTLHEIAVVALFLSEHGEALAERYVNHQAVESLSAAREYQRSSKHLGHDPLPAREMDALSSQVDEVVSRYGKEFGTQYGWAAEVLRSKRPSFAEIERSVHVDHLRGHYRMASHNVHANPKGVFFKLGLLSEIDVLLAGPSNAGLADPGHSTAVSLLQVSAALGTPTLDSSVHLTVLMKLEEQVGELFLDAHRRLEDEMAC